MSKREFYWPELGVQMHKKAPNDFVINIVIYLELVLNLTIEERVAVLETQVVEIEEDIGDLDEDVNFLFDETVIQDERLLQLETETEGIEEEVEGRRESFFNKIILAVIASSNQ